MTGAGVVDATLEWLGESKVSPVRWTRPEILAHADEGLQLFGFLTLFYERKVTISHPGSPFINLRSQITDFLAPLRISTPERRLRKSSLAIFAAEAETWFGTAVGRPPSHYRVGGLDLLTVFPPAAVNPLTVVYSAEPPQLATESIVVSMYDEDLPALLAWCRYRARIKDGGQELRKAIPFFQEFLRVANRRVDLVRGRAVVNNYDTMPMTIDRIEALMKPEMTPRPKPVEVQA